MCLWVTALEVLAKGRRAIGTIDWTPLLTGAIEQALIELCRTLEFTLKSFIVTAVNTIVIDVAAIINRHSSPSDSPNRLGNRIVCEIGFIVREIG